MSISSEFSGSTSSKKHGLSQLFNHLSSRIHNTSDRRSSKQSENNSIGFDSGIPIKKTHYSKSPTHFSSAGSSTSNSKSRSFLFDYNETSHDGLKVPKEVRECSICLHDLPLQSFHVLRSCRHRFCLQCLQQYLRIEITDSRVNISCPECIEPIHPSEIYMIINDEILREKYETFMLRRVLITEPEARWCPFPDCGYAVIASGCADCPKIKCGRPSCNTFFCYHCREEWHLNQTCDAARNLRHHHFSSQRTNGQEEDIKRCPRCRVLVVKIEDGSCNRMQCNVCGIQFCWLCMKEISGLHYFSSSGCTYFGKKPWSRKKKIMWQLGMLVGGAPVGIALIAGLAIPAIIIGIPFWVGLKLHSKYARLTTSKNRRNLIIASGVVSSVLVSPIIAGIAVGIGVPLSFFMVYVAVPILLSVYGSSGTTTTNSYNEVTFIKEKVIIMDDVSVEASAIQKLPNNELEIVNPILEENSVGMGASWFLYTSSSSLADFDNTSAYTNTTALELNPRTEEGSMSGSASLISGCEIHLDQITLNQEKDYDTDCASNAALIGSIASPSLTDELLRKLEVKSNVTSKKNFGIGSEADSALDNTKGSLAELLAASILGQRQGSSLRTVSDSDQNLKS